MSRTVRGTGPGSSKRVSSDSHSLPPSQSTSAIDPGPWTTRSPGPGPDRPPTCSFASAPSADVTDSAESSPQSSRSTFEPAIGCSDAVPAVLSTALQAGLSSETQNPSRPAGRVQPKSPSIPKSNTDDSENCSRTSPPGNPKPHSAHSAHSAHSLREPSRPPTTTTASPGSPGPDSPTLSPTIDSDFESANDSEDAGSPDSFDCPNSLLIVPIRVCSGSCVIPFLAKKPSFDSPHTVPPTAASTSESVHTAAGSPVWLKFAWSSFAAWFRDRFQWPVVDASSKLNCKECKQLCTT